MEHSKPGCPLVAKLDYKTQIADGNHLLTNCHLVSSHSMNLGSNDRNPTPGSNLVSNHSMNLGSNDTNPTPGSVAGPGAPALQQRP